MCTVTSPFRGDLKVEAALTTINAPAIDPLA